MDKIERMNKARLIKLKNHYKNVKEQAILEFQSKRDNLLFLAGLMLYWGEGDKMTNGLVRLTNTDTKLLQIFMKFLINGCSLPKKDLRIALTIYPDINEEEAKNFWSRILDIPHSQFIKSQCIIGREKRHSRKTTNGICSIYVCNKDLKEKIFTWLDLYSINFIGRA